MLAERIGRKALRIKNRISDVIASPGRLKLEADTRNRSLETQEFNTLLAQIKQNNTHCFFVSPHLDDGVLSAGDLIGYLSGFTKTHLVTVMTDFDPVASTNVKWMVKCGYSDPAEYMKLGREEDIQAAMLLGASSVHLGFPDMTYGSNNPETVSQVLTREISRIAGREPFVVFAPTAIGRQHKDHHMVNEIVRNLYPYPVLWQEFSLRTLPGTIPENQIVNSLSSAWSKNAGAKTDAIMAYKTQVPSLFPLRRVFLPREHYFFSADLISGQNLVPATVALPEGNRSPGTV